MADSYLTRSISSTGTNTKGTYSGWIKRSNIASDYPRFFAINTDANRYLRLFFHNDQKLHLYIDNGSGIGQRKTTRVFRDTSAWYHIVVAIDSLQGTASDRIKVYVNGVQETTFDSTINPAQGANMMINNSGSTFVIGKHESASTDYFNGYMSHVSWVDGQALAPTVFGQTDSTSGIWKFKSPSGVSWGTNGFHLKFENSAALGTDSSGQSNTFTVNGTLKQSIDTPSNVYSTLNPSFNLSDIQLTEAGMRTKNTNSNWKYINSTLAAPSGKWYCEHKININGGYVMVGVTDMQYATSQDKNSYTHCGGGTGGVGFYNADGDKYLQASSSTFASSYTTGDIIGCALDMDNNKVYFSKNGAWANGSGGYGSSTFDAAVGAITLPTTNATYGFAVSVRSNAVVQSNFGTGQFGATTITSAGSNGNGSLFAYDVPSGYYALNTKNINTYG